MLNILKKIIKLNKLTVISVVIVSVFLSLTIVQINLNVTKESDKTIIVKRLFIGEAAAAAPAAAGKVVGEVVEQGGKFWKWLGKELGWTAVAGVGVGVVAGPQLATAGLFLLLGWIVYLLAYVVGGILLVLVSILGQVVNYNGFIDVPTVITGWVIVRDISNMLFVLILLAIAFATILRIPSYEMKKALPKLLIMAVLINFSRTICGLIIDASQVVMASFIGAFIGGIDGHFVDLFMVDNYLTSLKSMAGAKSGWESLGIAASVIAGFIALAVTTIVLLVLVLVLIMRIIMLWIYVVLSPLAFMLSAFPAGQKYAQQWWSEFIKQVTTGPILAFFLWLALLTAQESSIKLIDSQATSSSRTDTPSMLEAESLCGNSSDIFCVNNLQTYIIVIGMLIGGLIVTQQAGGFAGQMAGKGLGWIQSGKRLAGLGVKNLAGFGVDKLHQKTGIDLNLARVYQGIKEKREEKRRERYSEGMQKAQEVMSKGGGRTYGLLAMTGTPGTAWENILSTKFWKQRVGWQGGGKNLAAKRAEIEPELSRAKGERDEMMKFGKEYAEAKPQDRTKMRKDLETRSKDLDSQITKETDAKKKAELVKDKAGTDNLLTFARDNFSEDKNTVKAGMDTMIEAIDSVIKAKEDQISKYIPAYDFEARAAEQKVVNEKMSRIKDVNESGELLRMLKDAIRNHDKSMIKAVTKKMGLNGDDNEYLQPLVGNTGYKGLQEMMQRLAGKGAKGKEDELYAGFTEQEAYGLGSEIAYTNRNTNHWADTGAFTMGEDGQWKTGTEKDHASFVLSETGKMNPREQMRRFNRLGYGSHDDKGGYEIDATGALTLKKLDSDSVFKDMLREMDESAAMYLTSGKARQQIEKLIEEGFFEEYDVNTAGGAGLNKDELIKKGKTTFNILDVLDKRAKTSKAKGKEGYLKQHAAVADILNSI